jgi:hypothetical protein
MWLDLYALYAYGVDPGVISLFTCTTFSTHSLSAVAVLNDASVCESFEAGFAFPAPPALLATSLMLACGDQISGFTLISPGSSTPADAGVHHGADILCGNPPPLAPVTPPLAPAAPGNVSGCNVAVQVTHVAEVRGKGGLQIVRACRARGQDQTSSASPACVGPVPYRPRPMRLMVHALHACRGRYVGLFRVI